MQEVQLGQRDIRQLGPFVGPRPVEMALAAAASFREWLGGRTLWTVSSTAVGGGVAEMLLPLLSYSRSLGVRIRWLVMDGPTAFFRVTKRVHHAIHGSIGDGSALDARARAIYDETSRANARALEDLVRPRDVVLLHDPQTAGLIPLLVARGAIVVWRSHIGLDVPSEEADRGWEFLAPDLRKAHAYVFSRREYVPRVIDDSKAVVIQPSIDALAPKNQPIEENMVRAILHHVGLVEGQPTNLTPSFKRTDDTIGKVERSADVLRHGAPPSADAPLVVQLSRWDPLKDMAGVMHSFAALVDDGRAGDAHLALVGPDVKGVTDDPEGPAVFSKCASAWRALPEEARARIALVMLPTADIEENAAVVNAVQRHAAIIAQKSLREGFGLTVTEAMWKGTAVIASAVGGIRDQIEHRVSGILLEDPLDLASFGNYVAELLRDPALAERYGAAGRERVREQFLGIRHLLQYAELFPTVGS